MLQNADYYLTQISADFGRGFKVEKPDPDADTAVYHVNIEGDHRTCECKGHLKHGHGKHGDGLAAPVKAGQV